MNHVVHNGVVMCVCHADWEGKRAPKYCPFELWGSEPQVPHASKSGVEGLGIRHTHFRLRDMDRFNPALRILARGCSELRVAQSGVVGADVSGIKVSRIRSVDVSRMQVANVLSTDGCANCTAI